MEDNDLKTIFEKLGDRIAVKDFCRKHKYPEKNSKKQSTGKNEKTVKN